jgi:hypothetical protein
MYNKSQKGKKAKGAPPYQPEGYFQNVGGTYTGKGKERTLGADKYAYDALGELNARDPGYSEDELRSIYRTGADEIDLGTQSSLRQVNRVASQTGGYGSGGHKSSLVASSERGARRKAGLQFDTQALAARVALEDRYRRIAAFQRYADPRLAMMQGEQSRRNAYQLGKVPGDQWATQYNNQQDQNQRDSWANIASEAADYWG